MMLRREKTRLIVAKGAARKRHCFALGEAERNPVATGFPLEMTVAWRPRARHRSQKSNAALMVIARSWLMVVLPVANLTGLPNFVST